jgi:glycine/D-amino acid oxidase-like deaminating enzyme
MVAEDVIVIGGGVVGASAAYALARRGARVTLVDRGDAGQATAAGAGILSPGTSIRPLPAFFAIGQPASAYYDTLLAQLAEDGETETGFTTAGLLHVATSAEERARLPELARLFMERLAAGFGQIGNVSEITGDEARTRFPALGPAVLGAVTTTGAARVDGRLLRDALRRAAERRGARIVTGDAALEVAATGGRVDAVRVGGERLTAGTVIVAGGAWSAALGEALGVSLPVFPQRGQILHLALPGSATDGWPIVVGFHAHYLLTFAPDRVVAGATRESASGFDVRVTAGGVHEALAEALRVAPGLAGATLAEVRIGLRPASPDGLPLLGRLPGYDNVLVATGHGPSGLQLGPYSGAVVAGLALGEPAPLELGPFAAGRFGQATD